MYANFSAGQLEFGAFVRAPLEPESGLVTRFDKMQYSLHWLLASFRLHETLAERHKVLQKDMQALLQDATCVSQRRAVTLIRNGSDSPQTFTRPSPADPRQALHLQG